MKAWVFLFLAGWLAACGNVNGNGDDIEAGSETDGDNLKTDGDLDATPPPLPDFSDETVEFHVQFDSNNSVLSDWSAIDFGTAGGTGSDWSVMGDGLTQWNLVAGSSETDPIPEQSALRSSELRYKRHAPRVWALRIQFTLYGGAGGIGLTLGNGRHELLYCADVDLCGGVFLRWRSQGETRALVAIDPLAKGERQEWRIAVDQGWARWLVGDTQQMAFPLETEIEGEIGILAYGAPDFRIHELDLWGQLGSPRDPPGRHWSIVANHGAGLSSPRNLFPEHTLVAFAHGQAAGADFIGVDVRLSRDGAPVLLHNSRLDITTDCTGNVADLDWETISACRAEKGSPWEGSEQFVLRLEQAVDAFPAARWLIELQAGNNETADVESMNTVITLMEERGLCGGSWIGSRDLNVLIEARKRSDIANLAWVLETVTLDDVDRAVLEGLDGLVLPPGAMDTATRLRALEEGLHLFMGPVDTPQNLDEWVGDGTEGFITNRPDRLAGSAWPL